jgi:hypothetical protein
MEQYRKVPVMISGNQNFKKDVAKSPKQMFSRKNPPTYRPIAEIEGQIQETNIFLWVA